MAGSELNNLGEHNNTTYEGGGDLCSLVEWLHIAWTERPAIRAAFTSRDQFVQTNLSAFESQRVSESTTIRELIGRFVIVTTP